ncbi:MAG: hypothetical protein MRK01_15220 [Candidatus Scalindua sp.]|nr:hypothetical protein [Candidatus Scalindua sp.]
MHEKSGLPRDMIGNLHGNNLEIVCLACVIVIQSENILADLNLERVTVMPILLSIKRWE